MITDLNLFEFAQKVATTYCKHYGSWDQYDDSVQEVCVRLLENRRYWNMEGRLLLRQEVLALIRKYQDSKGLRRKTRIEVVEYDPKYETQQTTERDDDTLESRELFTIATRKARLTEYEIDLVKKGVSGAQTRETLAKEHGVTVYRIEQLIKATTIELCKLVDEPVKGEKELCPLLYYAAE
ncbi:MAG: hypothetical protein ACI4NP_02655 [Thermoguttaceae bacterium]